MKIAQHLLFYHLTDHLLRMQQSVANEEQPLMRIGYIAACEEMIRFLRTIESFLQEPTDAKP